MIVTLAPASTPPVSSVTLPEIRPRLTCENAGRHRNSTVSAARGADKQLLSFIKHPSKLMKFVTVHTRDRNRKIGRGSAIPPKPLEAKYTFRKRGVKRKRKGTCQQRRECRPK